MSENEVIKRDFEEFFSLASELADSVPEAITSEYDVQSSSGSEDSLLFTLRRKSDGKRFAMRCSPLASGRAEREYEILSALDVSGVPRAVSYFEQGDFGWLVREYAEGEPLSELVAREGPLGDKRAAEIICRVCDILSYLHSRTPPVLHRDVKPQNVIIAPDGGVTLIDFDAARRFDDGASGDTEYLGTRAFAPPEQFGYAQTDCRSDVYSLGVLLLYLCTGSSELARASQLPEPLRSVVARCAAFSPDARYSDVLKVKDALTGGRAEKKKRVLYIALAALALAAGVFAATNGYAARPSASEAALNAALEATAGEGVYMVGAQVFATREEFFEAKAADPASYSRGEVSDLSALASSSDRLRELMLVNQPLNDLSALAGLDMLESLNLDYCGVTTLDGIQALPRLTSLSVTDTPVSGVSALADCAALDNLCVRGIPCGDFSPLAAFKRFSFLDIASIPCSLTLPQLEGCAVSMLKADRVGLSSLDALAGITGLETLEINGNQIGSLEGIERYPLLTYLNIARNPITDFSPLAGLPSLEAVICDEGQRAALATVEGGFETVVAG